MTDVQLQAVEAAPGGHLQGHGQGAFETPEREEDEGSHGARTRCAPTLPCRQERPGHQAHRRPGRRGMSVTNGVASRRRGKVNG